MPKINLLNKRKSQIKNRNIIQNAVWIIVTEENQRNYYVQKSDLNGKAIVWTPHLEMALKFHTEIGCQTFVRTYMKSRTDIHLKWIEDNV